MQIFNCQECFVMDKIFQFFSLSTLRLTTMDRTKSLSGSKVDPAVLVCLNLIYSDYIQSPIQTTFSVIFKLHPVSYSDYIKTPVQDYIKTLFRLQSQTPIQTTSRLLFRLHQDSCSDYMKTPVSRRHQHTCFTSI